MDDSPKMRNCLICEVPINECHLGIDSCRACSVFYKRTIKLNREWLKCKKGTDDCIEIKPTTSCRKCRFRKFSDILAQSVEPQEDVETESECDVERESPKPSTSSFLDHDSFSLMPKPPSETPLLDRIANGYSLLCVIRKTGEVPLIPPGFVPTQEMIDNEEMHFFPMRYNLIMPTGKVHIVSLMDFGNVVFEDFKKIPLGKRSLVLLGCFKYIVMMDAIYRSTHYFPDCDTRLAGYMFSASNENIETFLEGCPNEINQAEVAAAFRKNTTKLTTLKEQMKRLAPTELEFALLYGLCFWSNEISTVCEELTLIVEKNRKAIMDELHSFYKKQGRHDYAARLGEIYCFLSNVDEVCALAEADLELYKLMNIFTDLAP